MLQLQMTEQGRQCHSVGWLDVRLGVRSDDGGRRLLWHSRPSRLSTVTLFADVR